MIDPYVQSQCSKQKWIFHEMTIACSSPTFTKQTDTITIWLPICWGSTFLHHHFSCVGWGPRPIWPLIFVLPSSKGLESSFTKVHDPRTPPVVRIEPKAWKIEKVGKKATFFSWSGQYNFSYFSNFVYSLTLQICRIFQGQLGVLWNFFETGATRLPQNALQCSLRSGAFERFLDLCGIFVSQMGCTCHHTLR